MTTRCAPHEQFKAEDDAVTSCPTPSPPRAGGHVLSDVSRKFDIDGDGHLDEMERAMRNMDKSGKGYVSNEKVYQLMKLQVEMQKQIFSMRKLTVGLAVFTVVLALSNLGTAWAAAILSKETKVNPETSTLESKGTGVVLRTMAIGNTVFPLEVYTQGERNRFLENVIASSTHTVTSEEVETIWRACGSGTVSSLQYTCDSPNGGGRTTNIEQMQCAGSKFYTDPANANKVIYQFSTMQGALNGPILFSCDKGGEDGICNVFNLPCMQNFVTSGVSDLQLPVGLDSSDTDSEKCNKNIPNYLENNNSTPADMVCERSCECASNCCIHFKRGNRCMPSPPNMYMKCEAM